MLRTLQHIRAQVRYPRGEHGFGGQEEQCHTASMTLSRTTINIRVVQWMTLALAWAAGEDEVPSMRVYGDEAPHDRKGDSTPWPSAPRLGPPCAPRDKQAVMLLIETHGAMSSESSDNKASQDRAAGCYCVQRE